MTFRRRSRDRLVGAMLLGLAVLILPGPWRALAAGEPGLQTRTVPVGAEGRYTDVSTAGLARLLENKSFALINVHTPYAGEIRPTDLFIPFDQVEANLSKLPADKRARLVVYCRSGAMSAIAARTLVQLGYTDVWNLDGGMVAWADAGHAIARRSR